MASRFGRHYGSPPLPVIWPTVGDCQRALADFAAFHLSHGLVLLDALIAAIAAGLSAELCTFNDKHYRIVSGLADNPAIRPIGGPARLQAAHRRPFLLVLV